MEANTFLNKHQVESLREKQWSVVPNGKYITLYRDDFSKTAWEDTCHILNIPFDIEYVDVLFFGTQTNN
jgi:hypothetical protein